jgi:hypothetical protein
MQLFIAETFVNATHGERDAATHYANFTQLAINSRTIKFDVYLQEFY